MTFRKSDLAIFAAPGALAARGPIPWEDPNLPALVGLGRTLRQALGRPREFFRNLKGDGWAEPLAFGLMLGTAGLLACLYWQILLGAGVSRRLAEVPAAAQVFTPGAGALVAGMLLSPLIVLVSLGLSSLGLWAGVALVGGEPPPWPTILRITCYSQAGQAIALIPLLGGLISGLWVLILWYQGVKAVFNLSGGRVLGALAISLALQSLLLLLFLGSLMGTLVLGLLGFLLLGG
jgi:hypothetical protein